MKKNIVYAFAILLFIACDSNKIDFTNGSSDNSNTPPDNNENNENTNNTSNWSIPLSQVYDGGPGKDGIPSIDNPKFLDIDQIDFLNDSDLVIGTINGDIIKAYPHAILDWHEVVNDEINDEMVSINFCPLTGTAFGWKSISNQKTTTFGVSGLLYNSNLILYDRNTDSNWSQIKLECVNGQLIGNKPELVSVIEVNWKTWKTLYPNSKILSSDTGFSRNYTRSPYAAYKSNLNSLSFVPSILNNTLPYKERVYAIIDEVGVKSKAYQFSNFKNGNVIKDTFNGKEYLVVGNENIIKAFKLNAEQSNHLTFSYDFNNSESFFKDNEGNKWSVFGEAIEGPRIGEKLIPAKSVVSYWFAIAAFYPNPEIYSN